MIDGFGLLILTVGCGVIGQGVNSHGSGRWRVSGGVGSRKVVERGEVEVRSIKDEEVVEAERSVGVGPSVVVSTVRCLRHLLYVHYHRLLPSELGRFHC